MRVAIFILLLMVYQAYCLHSRRNSKKHSGTQIENGGESRTSKEQKKEEEFDLLQYLFNKPLRNQWEAKNQQTNVLSRNHSPIKTKKKKYNKTKPSKGYKNQKHVNFQFPRLKNTSVSVIDDHMPLLGDTTPSLHENVRNIPENPLSGNQYADALYEPKSSDVLGQSMDFHRNQEKEKNKKLNVRHEVSTNKNDEDENGSGEVQRHKVTTIINRKRENNTEEKQSIDSNIEQSGDGLGLINLSGWHSVPKNIESSVIKVVKKFMETEVDKWNKIKHSKTRHAKMKLKSKHVSLFPSAISSKDVDKTVGTTDALSSPLNKGKERIPIVPTVLSTSFGEIAGENNDTGSGEKFAIVDGSGENEHFSGENGHSGSGFLESMISSTVTKANDENTSENFSLNSKHYQHKYGKSRERKHHHQNKNETNKKDILKTSITKTHLDDIKTRLDHLKKFTNATLLLNLTSVGELNELTDSYIGKQIKSESKHDKSESISDTVASVLHEAKENPSEHLKHTVRRLHKQLSSKSLKHKVKHVEPHFSEENLPNMSDDIKVSNEQNNLQIQERTFFQNHNGRHKKHPKYDTRKDEIPHPPVEWKRDEISYRRDELPEYSLPPSGSMINSEQLLSYPAQYPELLNIQPMNKLYTSVQGLDNSEEDLLGRYLKKERQEEESFRNSDPDKYIQTDERGNLFQDDMIGPQRHHAAPTKLLDQKTLNEISNADEKTLSSLTRLDKNVLKDTSKLGQKKLMGASILGSDELTGVLNLLKQTSKSVDGDSAKEIAHGLKQDNNYVAAVQKLASDGMGTKISTENLIKQLAENPTEKLDEKPTEKLIHSTNNPTGLNHDKTTSASNTVSALHQNKIHRQAAHLLRNLAIRKKLVRIKLLEEKLQTLKRLEQSRRRHLLMSTTTTPTTSLRPLSPFPSFTKYQPTYHGISSPDAGLLKNFFGNSHDLNKPTNKSSIFQDALYDRGRILKMKFHDVTGDKKELSKHIHPTQLDEIQLSSRRHNFHLARNDVKHGQSNLPDFSSFQSDVFNNQTNQEEIDELKSMLRKGEEKFKTLRENSSIISETDDKPSKDVVTEHDDDESIDETVTENGMGRSMNEFKFNGQINVDPSYKGNVKVVHGTPPPEFEQAFVTTFPPRRQTTPFGPFFTLPPGHATQQAHLPTFKNGYPWVWYKNRKIPFKVVSDLKPTSSPEKLQGFISPTLPSLKAVTNTQPPNIISLNTVPSPLAEEYTLLTNLTQQEAALLKSKEKNKVKLTEPIQDAEIELIKSKDANTTLKTSKPEESSKQLTSEEIELVENKDSPTVTPPAVKNINFKNISESEIGGESIEVSKTINKINSTQESIDNKKQATHIKSIAAPIFVTYEQNSKHHHRLQPDDIILSDDLDKTFAETKTNIHLNVKGRLKPINKVEISPHNNKLDQKAINGKNNEKISEFHEHELRVLNEAFIPHKIPVAVKEHELSTKGNSNDHLLGMDILKENFDMHKADKIFLASKHANNIFRTHLKPFEKPFHIHSKPGTLYFEKPSDVDETLGDKRSYQLYSSYSDQEEAERKNINNTTATHEIQSSEGLKRTQEHKPTNRIEDFEVDDKRIDAKTAPTNSYVNGGTKPLLAALEPDVIQDKLLREYEEQSRLSQKYTNELLSPKESLANPAILPDSIQSILHTESPSKDQISMVATSPTAKENIQPSGETLPTLQLQSTTSTTTVSTTPSTTVLVSVQQATTKGLSVRVEQQNQQQPQHVTQELAKPTVSPKDATNVVYPTIRIAVTQRKAILPLGAHDTHEITTAEHLTHNINPAMYSQLITNHQPSMAIPTGSSYKSMVAPGAMIIEQHSQPKEATSKVKEDKSPIDAIVVKASDRQVMTLDLDKGTTKSPFEDELNLEDMYWTDSPDEIEHACKKQKGTNLVVNILAFGDSLTRGYYNKGKNHHPYTMKLQYLLNKMDAKRCFIVENEGKDGDLAIGDMPKRIEEVFKEKKKQFDWVIILGGTNDIYNKIHAGHHTITELTQNIIAVHNIAHHYASRTVVVTIPDVECESNEMCQDMKETREGVNENIRKFATDHKNMVVLCDLADSLVRHKISHKLIGQFFEGGLHLKPRGYETMAKIIFETLRQTLDKK